MYNFEAIFVMKGQNRFVTIVSMVTAPERSFGEKKRKRVTLINLGHGSKGPILWPELARSF